MPRLLAIAGAAAILVALTGCIQPKPPVTPTPTGSAAPVFPSEEEALAAAEESYAAYTHLSDQIFHEGGVGAELLSTVAVGDLLAVELDGFAQVAELGYRSVGETTFRDVVLQQMAATASGQQYLSVYLCEDVSGVDVLDSAGASVVSSERPPQTRFEVSFDLVGDTLLVSQKEAWDTTC